MRRKRRRSLHLTSCAKSMTPSCSHKPGFRAPFRRSCRRPRGCTGLLMAAASHREHGRQEASNTERATRAPYMSRLSCLPSGPVANYPLCLCARHSNAHLNMPLLGNRAPFTGPPFRIERTGKNVVLTAGRNVPFFNCETPVSRPLCWRTGSCDQSDDHLGTAHDDATAALCAYLTIQVRTRTSPGCAMSTTAQALVHRPRKAASGSFLARASLAGIGTLTKIGNFLQVSSKTRSCEN